MCWLRREVALVNAKGLARGPAAVRAAGKTVTSREMATHTWRRGNPSPGPGPEEWLCHEGLRSQQTIIITIVHVKLLKVEWVPHHADDPARASLAASLGHHFTGDDCLPILPQSNFRLCEFGVKVNNGELAEFVFECPDTRRRETPTQPGVE
jgi:hypothetical protein